LAGTSPNINLYFRQAGLKGTAIGGLAAFFFQPIGALAEMPFLFFSAAVFRRVGVRGALVMA
jgi:hypothetical protein